ncbi:MAG: PIN domain-containing protein [Leptolyngbyaceae cyanobacterium SU_3_3]|nr:PIN domain-containing protein [Leptolyngbyaceae cyanobacterium SU_3_3]
MILADTGFFVALGNRSDTFHSKAQQQLNILKEPLITTYPVIIETSYLLYERSGQTAQFKFLQQLTTDSIQIFNFQKNHLERAIQLMQQYANLPMDLADASLVVLAEELKENRILTTDIRDFSIYRYLETQPFTLLLS